MKTRTLSMLVIALLLVVAMTLPASAANEIIGEAKYTDIVAYIDGYPISSYNVNNNTYIMVEDLSKYGFGVTWDATTFRLVISTTRTAIPANYTTKYVAEPLPEGLADTKRADVYSTSVTTWIGDKQIEGFNIGGYTLIWMDDLAAHFSDSAHYVWSQADRALYMTSTTLPGSTTPTDPKPVEPPVEPKPVDPPVDPKPVEPVVDPQRAPELAVDGYVKQAAVMLQSGDFGDLGAMVGDIRTKYGEDVFQGFLKVFADIYTTMQYTFTGTTITGNVSSVGLKVTCRDLSTAFNEFTAKMFPQMNAISHMTGDQKRAAMMKIMLEVLSAPNRPMTTVQTAVKLDLVDGAWKVDLEKNTDFMNAITGGLYASAISLLG